MPHELQVPPNTLGFSGWGLPQSSFLFRLIVLIKFPVLNPSQKHVIKAYVWAKSGETLGPLSWRSKRNIIFKPCYSATALFLRCNLQPGHSQACLEFFPHWACFEACGRKLSTSATAFSSTIAHYNDPSLQTKLKACN